MNDMIEPPTSGKKSGHGTTFGSKSGSWSNDEDSIRSQLIDGTDEKYILERFWSYIEAYLPIATKEVDDLFVGLRSENPTSMPSLIGAESHKYLTALRIELLVAAQSCIQKLSPSTWLWYLRRVDPSVVAGSLPTTPINVMRVAENISMSSRRSFLNDKIRTETPFSFALDSDQARTVAKLVAFSEYVNRLENHIRRAAKGQAFDFSVIGIPEVIEESRLEGALEAYDSRSFASNAIVWHPSIEYNRWPPALPQLMALATRNVAGWDDRTGWVRVSDSIEEAAVFGQFDLIFSRLSDTGTSINLAGSAAGMKNPRVAACLVALSNAVARYTIEMPHVGAVVPAFGYVIIHHGDLIDFLKRALEEDPWGPLDQIWSSIEASEVVKTLKRHPEPGAASAGGAIIRSCLVGQMIDLFSLSCEIHESLRVDAQFGGQWVNAAAFDFELAVQRAIDISNYRPSVGISKIRGVTLLGPDGPITDIDAVMEIGSTLVVVSCKKVESSQDFDRGEYNRIRNNESTIVSALSDWSRITGYLRDCPRGRNYDFTEFDNIQGIVVSPGTVFLSDVEPLKPSEFLPSNLREHMSYGELVLALFKAV